MNVAMMVYALFLGAVAGTVTHLVLRGERWVAGQWSWYRQSVRPMVTKPIRWYRRVWWRLLPDGLFLMWLRAGVIDADTFRWLQENGYVSVDVDPAYITGYRGEDVD